MASRKAELTADQSFLAVLGIAVLLLVAATVVFGVFGGQLNVTGQLKTIASFDNIGAVGFLNELPAKTIAFSPFTAGVKQLDSLKKIPELVLSAGTLGSQSLSLPIVVPGYYADSLTGVKITFDVYKAGMAPLRVKWNGKEFFADTAGPRPQSVFIPRDDVKISNTLDLAADGPGFAFWAVNSYTLRDVNVQAEYGPAKLFAIELSAADLQALTKGEISFFSLGEGGTLTIKLNGVALFSQNARGQQTVNFSLTSAPFAIGNNILSFSAEGGEFDLRNGEIRIYTVGNQQIRERSFNVTAEQLAPLTQGVAKTTISSISRPGSIRLQLNGQQVLFQQLEPGTLSATFPKEVYRVGENTIKASGTGAAILDTIMLGGS